MSFINNMNALEKDYSNFILQTTQNKLATEFNDFIGHQGSITALVGTLCPPKSSGIIKTSADKTVLT